MTTTATTTKKLTSTQVKQLSVTIIYLEAMLELLERKGYTLDGTDMYMMLKLKENIWLSPPPHKFTEDEISFIVMITDMTNRMMVECIKTYNDEVLNFFKDSETFIKKLKPKHITSPIDDWVERRKRISKQLIN